MSRPNLPERSAREEREAWREEKARRHRQRRNRVLIVLFFVVLIVALAVGGFTLLRSVAVPFDTRNADQVDVVIPDGASVSDIAAILEDEKIIRSATVFKLYVRGQGTETDFQAGTHKLSPSMSMDQVIKELRSGESAVTGNISIQIPEGYNIDQIADVVAEKTRYSRDDFLDLLQDPAFVQKMVNAYPELLLAQYNQGQVRYVFEGYLFPATYDFSNEAGLEPLVINMLEKTKQVLSTRNAAIQGSEYSLNEIMTMASLVEKEGIHSEDRKEIAGVFYNRLDEGMALQSDISILYALNEHKEMVSHSELEINSPYNLYRNTGLGPGPFNNPGEESIDAALEPTDTDAIYFFANLKTGEVFFTRSFDEHLAWQKEYEETGHVTA